MRAHLLIRHEPHYRRGSFESGLRACGFQIDGQPRQAPGKGDLLVIWNRYGPGDKLARRWAELGGIVIVAENGLLGRHHAGGNWYSLALGAPAAGGGVIAHARAGENRAAAIRAEFGEWRRGGREVIVLGQRGIGPPGIASPELWAEGALATVRSTCGKPARIRIHPGENAATPLEEDLADAHAVVTWSSGAAVRALMMGIPVFYSLTSWIGRGAATWWKREKNELDVVRCDDAARLETFEKIGRATWSTAEIETGEPFRRLLERAQSPSIPSATTRAASSPAA
jgi:hypothetical protein